MAARLAERVCVVRDSGPARDPAWSRRLAGILRDHEVDVLHVRGLSMLPDALMAAERAGDTAVAFSFHGFESTTDELCGIRRKVYREALLRCDDRWAVSEAAARSIAERLHVPRETIGVIANGVSAARYRPVPDRSALRRGLALPTDRFVVLSVGNLKPIKRHGVLLEAIRRLGTEARQLCAVFIGEDYLEGRLQRWVGRHLSDCDIRFVGAQADVLPWYQAADVFVQASLYEGMSNALLEAMACGLAVVATRVGGNTDVIEDERTGLLVPPDDAAAICRAIRRLRDDDVFRDELSVAAREHVRHHFAAAKSIARHAERYERLAEWVSSEADGLTPVDTGALPSFV